ncbi:MAG: serine acetyltransferase [Sphingobacteriaceae bacterium]|jgi:serine O-acetyltransferase|nr:serine acetyltransferase [Sphingobacteriaceae bacterium]
MNQELLRHLKEKQQVVESVPSNDIIKGWVQDLIFLLYPEHNKIIYPSTAEIDNRFDLLKEQLLKIFKGTTACDSCDNELKAEQFFDNIPELYRVLNTDVDAIFQGDPSAKSRFEVVRAYPGFFAICFYRIAHSLLKLGIPLLPRIITECIHAQTGIDIHPGAEIGEYFYIDHGTGLVIGETCKIGKHVKVYQGVTLGALSVEKELAETKRHPTVEDSVVIYANATVLGGHTVIGHHSIIGGNVWITKSVPPFSTIYHTSTNKVIENQ